MVWMIINYLKRKLSFRSRDIIPSGTITMTKSPRQNVRVGLVLFPLKCCYGHVALQKSPFGLAKNNCRLQNIKEVRFGVPRGIAVNDSIRAQMSSTPILRPGKVHSRGGGSLKGLILLWLIRKRASCFSQDKKLQVEVEPALALFPPNLSFRPCSSWAGFS